MRPSSAPAPPIWAKTWGGSVPAICCRFCFWAMGFPRPPRPPPIAPFILLIILAMCSCSKKIRSPREGFRAPSQMRGRRAPRGAAGGFVRVRPCAPPDPPHRRDARPRRPCRRRPVQREEGLQRQRQPRTSQHVAIKAIKAPGRARGCFPVEPADPSVPAPRARQTNPGATHSGVGTAASCGEERGGENVVQGGADRGRPRPRNLLMLFIGSPLLPALGNQPTQ